MNLELDYIEEMKKKTIGIIGQQVDVFRSKEVDRVEKRKELEEKYNEMRLADVHQEFVMREEKRQREFDTYLQKMEKDFGSSIDYLRNPENFKNSEQVTKLMKDVDIQYPDPDDEERREKLYKDQPQFKSREGELESQGEFSGGDMSDGFRDKVKKIIREYEISDGDGRRRHIREEIERHPEEIDKLLE